LPDIPDVDLVYLASSNVGVLNLFLFDLPEAKMLKITVTSEAVVPDEYKNQIYEFINIVNNGLIYGNFSIASYDRTLMFRLSIDTFDREPNREIIATSITFIVQTMEMFVPGVAAICEQGYSPAEAHDTCRKMFDPVMGDGEEMH
jgi:hypothetical protein